MTEAEQERVRIVSLIRETEAEYGAQAYTWERQIPTAQCEMFT